MTPSKITVDAQKPGLQITWLSVFLNIFLGVLKCTLGVFAHSKALIADGLHSLLDLATDTLALFGLKMSCKPEDANHLYGHHKFSSLSTLFISVFLLIFCVGLIFSSVKALLLETGELPTWPTLVASGISVLIKEALFWRTRAIARRLRSRLLLANAWHHRTDSLSSVLVFVSLGVIMFGGEDWLFLDNVVAILLGVYIGFQGVKLLKQSSDDLLDTAPERDMINDLREHILPTPGAIAYHNFRVRRIGDLFEVDLHLQVSPSISVEEGHKIAAQVKKNILEKHSDVLEVLVHIEPANPEHIKDAGIHDVQEES